MGLASITRGSLVIGLTAVALCVSTLSPATARADEAVQRRLTKFGKLSPGDAKRVEGVVSARMKRAADMTSNGDPLRTAVSQALFHTPVPGDSVAAAKVRLRLYAGLTEWALENVFAPQPGLIPACASAFGLPPGQCAALVAASGKISPADAAQRAGGSPAASGPPSGPAQAPPANYGYAQQRPSYGGYGARPAYGQPAQSHFGRYNSGYQQNAAPQQAYGQPRPAYQPQQAPAAAPRPAPTPVVSAADRRAEYQRRRQEQLDRMRQEMAARKAKIVATAGGTDRVQRGPSSAAEAEAAGLDKSSVAAPTASKGNAPAKAEAEAEAPADDSGDSAPKAAAKPANKPLDDGLLDGLLGDPLGKSK